MNIALYGISRSGKNYLIAQLLKKINLNTEKILFHVNGSETLDSLSNRIFGIPLKDTTENQKKRLRLAFHDELPFIGNSYRHKIIDGHYCFCNDGIFEIAFSDRDRDVYDMFFYLNTPADRIIEQANKDPVKKNVAAMSEEKINAWKNFEIQALRKTCLDQCKEFVMLDNNIEDCLDYFETLLLGTRNILLNSRKIAEKIITENKSLINKYNKIILLDCDRTISNNDTTYDFCMFMNINKNTLKNILSCEHYSLYQFFRIAKLYGQKDLAVYKKASDYALEKMSLNTTLIEDIKNNGNEYLSIGITSGVFETWQKIKERYGFPRIIAGGSNIRKDTIVISRAVKYHLAKVLHEEGKYVIAVGDSIMDIDMLNEADKGFIVAQEKVNEKIKEYCKNTKSKLLQLEYNKFIYDNIVTKRSLFL
jgi:phosphoserine phosphatase